MLVTACIGGTPDGRLALALAGFAIAAFVQRGKPRIRWQSPSRDSFRDCIQQVWAQCNEATALGQSDKYLNRSEVNT